MTLYCFEWKFECRDQLQWRFNKPDYSTSPGVRKEIVNITETRDEDILACGYATWHKNHPTIYERNIFEDLVPIKKIKVNFLDRIDFTEITIGIFYISIFDSKGNSIQTETLVKRNR